MLSLEDLLNSWGLWKSSGEIKFQAGGSYLQDKVQTSGHNSRTLLLSDKPQKLVDALINRHLTKTQCEVIAVEYRAQDNIPHFKNYEQRANYLQLTGKAYRDRLHRAKTMLNAYLL